MMPSTVSRTALLHEIDEHARPMTVERWEECLFLISTHRLNDVGGPVPRIKVDQFVEAMQDMADEIARQRRHDGP